MTAEKMQGQLEYWTELERIRYHEASHTLFMYIFGFRPLVMRVGSEPIALHDRRTTAFFRQQRPWSSVQRAKVDQYALIVAAGVLAEYKRNPSVPLDELWRTAGVHDLEDLYELARRVWRNDYPGEWPKEAAMAKQIERWIQWASRALDKPKLWDAIAGLVEESYSFDGCEIKGDDLTELLQEMLPKSRSAYVKLLTADAPLPVSVSFSWFDDNGACHRWVGAPRRGRWG